MNIDKYLLIRTESELKELGSQGLFDLRKKASQNADLDTLMDIATYRLAHGSMAIFIDLLPELAFLYGKANRIDDFNSLISAFRFAFISVSPDCITKTKNMLEIGYKYPYLDDSELDYLESLWCDSNSFEWMDIIMYDSYKLPRLLKKFDESLIKKVNTDFSDDLLYKIYDLFEEDKNDNNLPFYDRKTNAIIRKAYKKKERGEYVIDYTATYDVVNNHIMEQYGKDCADYFATQLMKKYSYFNINDIEKFKSCTYLLIPPSEFIKVASLYFKDENEINNLKKWFARDYLQKCNNA